MEVILRMGANGLSKMEELAFRRDRECQVGPPTEIIKNNEDTLPWQCKWRDCINVFHSHADLREHVTVHVERWKSNFSATSFPCRWKECAQSFTRWADLLDHVSQHAAINAQQHNVCRWVDCELVFGDRMSYLAHLRNHSQTASMVTCLWTGCYRNGFKFTRRCTLTQHMLETHGEWRPYLCPLRDCTKAFRRKSELRRHLLSIHRTARVIVNKITRTVEECLEDILDLSQTRLELDPPESIRPLARNVRPLPASSPSARPSDNYDDLIPPPAKLARLIKPAPPNEPTPPVPIAPKTQSGPPPNPQTPPQRSSAPPAPVVCYSDSKSPLGHALNAILRQVYAAGEYFSIKGVMEAADNRASIVGGCRLRAEEHKQRYSQPITLAAHPSLSPEATVSPNCSLMAPDLPLKLVGLDRSPRSVEMEHRPLSASGAGSLLRVDCQPQLSRKRHFSGPPVAAVDWPEQESPIADEEEDEVDPRSPGFEHYFPDVVASRVRHLVSPLRPRARAGGSVRVQTPTDEESGGISEQDLGLDKPATVSIRLANTTPVNVADLGLDSWRGELGGFVGKKPYMYKKVLTKAMYSYGPYPEEHYGALCSITGLNSKQIKDWFHQKRSRLRKAGIIPKMADRIQDRALKQWFNANYLPHIRQWLQTHEHALLD